MARAGLQYLEAEPAPADAPAPERPGLKYLADEEEPGRLEALLRGLKQGATLGFGDELTGLAESAFSDKTYRQARDEARANDAAAREAHGGYFAGGELGGGLATALIPGALGARAAGAGLKGAAALGAAYGAGESTADLTEGDVGGLARDVAVGAGAGALAHGAVGLVGKGLRAGEKYLSSAAKAALEGEAGSAARGVAGSKLGRAAAGAAAGAYADDDAVEGALKGAAAGLAGPALYRGVKGAGKAAIVAALKRRVAAAAERIAARAGPAAEWEAVPAAAEAVERATAAPVTRETALARVVKPDAYLPPGAPHALEGEPERLALGPVPEAPPPVPDVPAAAVELTAPEAMDRVIKAARAGALTQDLIDQATAAGVPQETLERRLRMLPGKRPVVAAPSPPMVEADAGPATAATAEAVAEFKDAVAKANRLAASGDKMRASLWLKDAEKKFKAAMAGAQR